MLFTNIRPHLPKWIEMQINRSWTDFTSAGKWNSRPSRSCKDCTEKNNWTPCFTHQFNGNIKAVDIVTFYEKCFITACDGTAEIPKNVDRCVNIGKRRTIVDYIFTFCKDRGGNNRQSAVFCPLNFNLSVKLFASCNKQFWHNNTLSKRIPFYSMRKRYKCYRYTSPRTFLTTE